MNKLLVTGMAVGRIADRCIPCHYDLDWLINYPAALLWSDRILIPETIWNVIQNEEYPNPPKLAKACKLIFDIAKDQGVIEISDPSPMLITNIDEAISTQIDRDIENIKIIFADKVSERDLSLPEKDNGPIETTIDGVEFCPPYLQGIYTNLMLAKIWGANCLFDLKALHYLRYKFGIEAFPKQADSGRIKSFTSVFESYFPNMPILPEYALEREEKCKVCQSEITCKQTYLKEIETRTIELLKWRKYDEINQARTIVDKIVDRRDASIIDPNAIAIEFHEQQLRLVKRTRTVFPKIKRWANVTTIISIPLAIAGLSSGASLLTLTGAAATGIAQLGKQYIQFYESKYQWVSFMQSMAEKCQEMKGKKKGKVRDA